MSNVIPLPPKPTPVETLFDLLIESQHLATKSLDILRAKNEILMGFNSAMLDLTREQLAITARQSDIGLAIQRCTGL